jgi:hypothetical protein
MKARNWILAISLVVVLAFLVANGQSGLSAANAKSSVPAVGMGDFLKIENQSKFPETGGPASALRAGMADFRILEYSQNARVGIGDLHKLESDQNRPSTVGMGDLQRFEAGR